MGTLQPCLQRVGRSTEGPRRQGWEAVSMVPVVIEARPVSTRMRFNLVMKRQIPGQVVDEWPETLLVTDEDR